jgi:deoxycytidine triphosphate deaminase
MANQGTPLKDGLTPQIGMFTDGEIIAAIEHDQLLARATIDSKQAKYASYELRASAEFQEVTFSDRGIIFSPQDAKKSDNKIKIEPGGTVKVYAIETAQMPSDVFGHIISVGQLFSAGLAAETTYVDPGFHGRIYITLSNISPRTLILEVGCPLARIQFHRLSRPVNRAHQGGEKIRPTFVDSQVDESVRTIFAGKKVDVLLSELPKSLSEVFHRRATRSEILVERAHEGINNFHALQKATKRVQIFSSILVALIVANLLQQYGILAQVYQSEWFSTNIGDLAKELVNNSVAAIIGLIAYFVQKKIVR